MLGGGGRTRPAGGSDIIRAVQHLAQAQLGVPCPPKPVKQRNGCVYWLTRDVAVGLARLRVSGRVKEESSTLVDVLAEFAMSP